MFKRNRFRPRTWGALALLTVILALALAGIALANGTSPAIDWYVFGGGGGHASSDIYTVDDTSRQPNVTLFSMDGTIGQPVVGLSSNDGFELCAGFWCRVVEYRIYLPLILRNYG